METSATLWMRRHMHRRPTSKRRAAPRPQTVYQAYVCGSERGTNRQRHFNFFPAIMNELHRPRTTSPVASTHFMTKTSEIFPVISFHFQIKCYFLQSSFMNNRKNEQTEKLWTKNLVKEYHIMY